jgi:hypothetical protein
MNMLRVAGGGDPAEGRGPEEVVREVEVWVVKQVEGFGAEWRFTGYDVVFPKRQLIDRM